MWPWRAVPRYLQHWASLVPPFAATGYVLIGFGLFIDPNHYTNPAYQVVATVPLRLWGVAFLLTSIIALVRFSERAVMVLAWLLLMWAFGIFLATFVTMDAGGWTGWVPTGVIDGLLFVSVRRRGFKAAR